MKNTIIVSVEFFFKGEKLSPSMTIDLDAHIQSQHPPESLIPILAQHNNIGPYSYEYEMLEAEQLVFSAAEGLAKNFLENGVFDFDAFKQAWHENRIAESVADIARTHLAVEDLSTQADLKNALIERTR